MTCILKSAQRSAGQATTRLVCGSLNRRAFSISCPHQQQQQPQKLEWLVIMPDKPGALETRMSVRQKHLSKVKEAFDAGFWVLGGATLDAQPTEENQVPQINGSIMLAVADSREEVLEQLRRDVYSTSGVWDWDRVEIRPFRSAIRKEL